MRDTKLRIGQRVKCDPLRDIGGQGSWDAKQTVIGTIVYVNAPHRWFLVAYGESLRTGYKFCDLGDRVELYG